MMKQLIGMILLAALFLQASLGQSDQMSKTRGVNHRRKLPGKDTPSPTPAPTFYPTPKQMGGMTTSSPTQPPLPPIQVWTESPIRKPTNWPTVSPVQAPVILTPAPVIPTPAPVVATSRPTFPPATFAPITVTDSPVIATDAPSDAPTTKRPTRSPSAKPSRSPVEATDEPSTSVPPTSLSPTTLSPTTSSPTTVSPTTVSPTTVPPTTVSPTTVSPTKGKTEENLTKEPTGSPAALNATATDLSNLALLDFNILLKSSGNGVNVGQLDKTLESYLQNGMTFTNLESISLTLVEGDTAESQVLTATSVRFSCLATFSGELPLHSAVEAEQGELLEALPDIQAAIDQNTALSGATVAEVSFDRIDAAASMGAEEGSSSAESNHLGVLLGVVSVASVAAIAAALFIVRHRRLAQKKVPAAEVSTPETKEVVEDFVDVKPGCGSLVSGEVSLGDGDLSTYMMTASPKTYDPINTTSASPKRPEEISICQTGDFDDNYDDNYLTMDETSVAL